MIRNFGYKILTIALTLIIVIIAIVAWSPRGHTPILYNSATLDFANTAAGTATDLTINVTGAVDADAVLIGVPNAATVANGHFVGWVSSAGVVTIRFLNNNLLTALDPASAVFEVIVFKK